MTNPASKSNQQPEKHDESVSIIPFPGSTSSIPNNLEVIPASPKLEPTRVESATINLNVKPNFSNFAQWGAKSLIFLAVVGVLFYGRYSVPDNAVPCVVDKIMDGLSVLNDFINKKGHEEYRRAFQILCSLLIDISFLLTFGYWILRGTSLRFPLTLGIFYVVRAVVQMFWMSPFPAGFYWTDPGFPSLVVPYGVGSDFFFSGHSGFMVICAKEAFASKNKKLSYVMWLNLAYTIMILLTYRIHYSIDIFTGVFFADWCFFRVSILVRYIDPLCIKILLKSRNYIKNEAFRRFLTKEDSR